MDPNTRQSKRTPVTLKIKFKSETLAQFIERYAVDVSQGGIFIRTKEPLAAGTPMRFEFQLKDASPLIAGEGTVVWTRENDPTRPGVAPGMGVRFDRLAEGSQEVLDKILAEKAKQSPGGRNTADTKPPPGNAFQEVPTRVAPSPLVNALAGESSKMPAAAGRGSGSFGDSRADTTPLPNPMPFHSDADEFPDEAFEEATKVRPLDELVAQSAAVEREQHPPDIAEALDELAARRAARTSAAPGPTGTPVPVGAPPQLSTRDATTVSEGSQRAQSASAPPYDDRGRPRMLDTSPSPRTGIPREPSTKVPVAAVAEPLPPPAAAPRTGSRAPVIVILVLIAMAAGAAAVWFFVLRKPDKTTAANGTQIASNIHPSGSAGSAQGTHPGSQMVASGATTGTGSAGSATGSQMVASGGSATEPAADLVSVVINSNAEGAQVEVVATGTKGPAPFDAKVEKGKKAAVRVSAPGFVTQDLEVTGGDKPVTVKLKPMDRVVHVTSTPSGASIFVNNGPTGKQTPADIKLASALLTRPKITITVRKSGYNKGETTVVLADYAETDGKLVANVEQALTVSRPTHTGGSTGTSTGTSGSGSTTGSGSTGTGTTTGSGGSTGTGTTTGSGGTTTGSGSTGTTGNDGSGSTKPPDSGSGSTKPDAGTGSAKSSGSGAGSAKSGSGSEPVPDWMK